MVRLDKFKFYDVVIYAARSSNGARRLATALGSRRWRDDLPERYRRRRPYFRGNNSPLVVNWGSTRHPGWLEDQRFRLDPVFVNRASSVQTAINKLSFFQQSSRIDGVPLLKWTDKKEVALGWIGKGKRVICRTRLDGSSGSGIVAASTAEQLVDAPLYTRYYPKTHEFRVHVFNGEVIDLTQKKLKGGSDARNTADTLIRSHDNGWVHAHGGIDLSLLDRENMERSCVGLVNGLNLNFGAVDVLAILDPLIADGPPGGPFPYRPLRSFAICEVNTGPGLENTQTIEAYTRAILKMRSDNVGSINNLA